MYEKLYAENKGLLHIIAWRYAWACKLDRAVSVEDLVQTGFFGLVKAAKTYDSKGEGNWWTWAAWYVMREIYNEIGYRDRKFRKAHTGALPLDVPLGDDPDGATQLDALEDTSLPDIDEGVLLDDLQRRVREAVDALRNDKQREAIKLCGLEERPYREAAEALGISSERVRQIIRDGYKQLKRDKRLANLYDVELRTVKPTRSRPPRNGARHEAGAAAEDQQRASAVEILPPPPRQPTPVKPRPKIQRPTGPVRAPDKLKNALVRVGLETRPRASPAAPRCRTAAPYMQKWRVRGRDPRAEGRESDAQGGAAVKRHPGCGALVEQHTKKRGSASPPLRLTVGLCRHSSAGTPSASSSAYSSRSPGWHFSSRQIFSNCSHAIIRPSRIF